MSIPFSGTVKRSGGVSSAIAKQLRIVNLKPVKKIEIKFDPFHDQIEETRSFMVHLSTQRVLDTNINCSVKTQILCDRSEPTISFNLVNGEKVVFKSALLTALEMLKIVNQKITILAPKEEETKDLPVTKSAKKLKHKK